MGFLSAEVLGAGWEEYEGATPAWDQAADGCTTLTEDTGSNRALLIAVGTGYSSDSQSNRYDSGNPASITVGGQTLNLVVDGCNDTGESGNDAQVALYYANEATIAAMTFTANEANWSVQFARDGVYYRIVALWYDDIDQTAGVVDSDYSTTTSATQTLQAALSLAASDLIIAATVSRGDSGNPTTSDTSRNVGNSGGTTGSDCVLLLSEKASPDTSENITASTGSGAMSTMVGLALRPASSGYTLACDGATYAVTGTDATFAVGMSITAEAGTYAVTGTDATFDVARALTAEAGAFVVTGTAATFGLVRLGDAGEFLVTGSDVTFTVGFMVSAEAGTFAVTGTAADLEVARTISAEAGSYAVTGQAATLTADRVMDAGVGSFLVAGSDVTLTYTAPGSYSLTAEAAAYAVTGSDATLDVARTLNGETVAFTVTGTAATLLYARIMAASSATFVVTGTDAGLNATSDLTPGAIHTLGADKAPRYIGSD